MTPTKEVLEYCIGLKGGCLGCPGFEGDDPGNETCVQKFAKELLAKCAEVEELRKALRNARAALSCKDPVIADMERSCALSMIDKALEGKE